MVRSALCSFILVITFLSNNLAQNNTIGLVDANENMAGGYTLFAPNSSKTTYLIDECGNLVNAWLSERPPGLSAYLLPNGNLLRTRKESNNTFFAGGVGGAIEIFDWEGNLVWEFVLADEQNILHHDIAPMDNGNILAIAYDFITQEEAIANGRLLELTSESGFWVDKIFEIKPLPNNNFEIVWEWSSFDHIVQDVNNNGANFGIVSEAPGKFDINYTLSINTSSVSQSDWLHSNAIDYNEELDQIILNARNYSEFYIIDHSTTTEEAKGSTGGKYGKGGDLLYRWGNPAAYDSGVVKDQKLFNQHDAHWIDKGLEDEGKVFVFNNGVNRPGGTISTVDIIDTPVRADGSYQVIANQAFGPAEAAWSYGNNANDVNITSSRISGVTQLENGSIFVCVGGLGRFLELDENLDIAWDYISPLAGDEALTQGDDPTFNTVFRAYRYPLDYPAFSLNEVRIGSPIELNAKNEFCNLLPTEVVIMNENPLKVINTLATNQLLVRAKKNMDIAIVDVMGRTHIVYNLIEGDQSIELSTLSAGSYNIYSLNNRNTIFEPLRFVKID